MQYVNYLVIRLTAYLLAEVSECLRVLRWESWRVS